MYKNRRIEKVSSLLKKEISLILMNDFEDDFIIENFVSITKIELSGDLQHCKIYITASASENDKNKMVEKLNIAKSSIRHLLGKRIEMRRIPELVFKKDRLMDEGLSVLKVLDELRENNNLLEKD